MDWYVIHTQTGAEDRARAGIQRRIDTTELKKYVEEIVVPTEQVSEVRGGKKRITTRKFFPGYILIKMNMTKESWYLIKTTPGVTSFIGPGRQPQKLSEEEVNNILKRTVETEAKPSPKIVFDINEPILITQGPFANFNGSVMEVSPDRGKLKVSVPVFGRATLVELEYWQVEKI
jgi:transcriptional antiterminator NusG